MGAKKKISKIVFLFSSYIVLFLLALSFNVQAINAIESDELEASEVLFISSYSPAFNTFYHQIDGLHEVFEGYPVTLDMEFMDSKRYYTEENLAHFYQTLEYKIAQHGSYDLIIVSDDNGINFVMEHRDVLFPTTPIVFFGINNEENARLYSANPLVTGVVEKVSMEDTIQLALDLNPDATKVVALADSTTTGQADLQNFYTKESSFPNHTFTHIDLSQQTLDAYLEEVANISNDSVVLLLSALRGQEDVTYNFDDSLELIMTHINQPLYHLYEHGIGDGLLGGRVVSHFIQGEKAAEIALSVLAGNDIADIPLIEESPNVYMIDYNVLVTYDLDEDVLPASTIFLNKDESFFEQYKLYVVPAILFIVIQAIIIIALIVSLKNRNKARLEALDSKEKLLDTYQALEESNEELTYASFHDKLTGLHNRNYFDSKFDDFDQENAYPVSIILADVNGLKLINDAFGHLNGDEALIKTALLLEGVFDEAKISRIGGDEFAIMNAGKSKDYLFKKIQGVREQAKDINIKGVDLSLSLGMAIKESDATSMKDLFTEAEDWMYREKLHQVPSNRSSIIDTIIETINQKDEYSQIHSKRVSLISAKIAELYNFDENVINDIKTAGLLHDIGKIIIPTNILNKNGKLNKKEYEEIKKHSEIGFRILNSVSEMREIAEYVFCHHEKIDGTGYPRGLKGDQIPIQSKIIAVADAMDAMMNTRFYRSTFTRKECYEELLRFKGSQFCAETVDIVLDNFDVVCDQVECELDV